MVRRSSRRGSAKGLDRATRRQIRVGHPRWTQRAFVVAALLAITLLLDTKTWPAGVRLHVARIEQPVDIFVRSDLHLHEFFWCRSCSSAVGMSDYPVRCSRCGHVAERLYLTPAPVPPAFEIGVKIEREGRLLQDVKLGPSRSKDGWIATRFQERDRRDEDKTQHRYRKKVIRADGFVEKDVDVFLTNQSAHGNAGTLRDPESREPPGDPLYVKLDWNQPRPSRRAFM